MKKTMHEFMKIIWDKFEICICSSTGENIIICRDEPKPNLPNGYWFYYYNDEIAVVPFEANIEVNEFKIIIPNKYIIDKYTKDLEFSFYRKISLH